MNTLTIGRNLFRLLTLLIIAGILIICSRMGVQYSHTYMDNTPRIPTVAVYENGSFELGLITGCMPNSLCD